MGVSRGAWTLYLKRRFSRSSGFDDEVPFDAARVFVELAAAEGICLDLHILVIGERELIVDDDADGQSFAVVDGDFPRPLSARACR